jgi:hypothetical protein
VGEFESGNGDVHCNVWQDEELFAQLDYLEKGGFLSDLQVCARRSNEATYCEFYVALRRVAEPASI